MNQRHSLTMETVTSTWHRFTICLAVVFIACPSLTYQELPASTRRFALRPDATGNAPKLSSLFQQRSATFDGSRHMAAAMAGNVTLENISDSLIRQEENLASLIQSLLTVQRSVFNLEQLQELLVLLLEDILKQSGSVDTNPGTDPQPRHRDSDSGGKSLLTDSSDNDNGGQSTDNEDDENNKKIDVVADNNAPRVSGLNSRRLTGNGMPISSFQAIHEIMSELNKGHNTVSGMQASDDSTVGGTEDSVGGSSEGGGSNSNEDVSDFRTAMQRSTQSAVLPISSSQKPHWSEPLTANGNNNIHARFMDIASRLGQSFPRNSSPRILGYMNMHPTSRMKNAEATFDRPPIYQPLEVVPVQEHIDTTEKKLHMKMFPIKIKLHQESVISHGGPLTGPENFSSPFLEFPEDHEETESTGERSTGMINNLVQSNTSHSLNSVEDRSHPAIDLTADSIHSDGQLPMPDIRRKRHAHSNTLTDTNVTADSDRLDVLVTLENAGNDPGTDSSVLKQTTLATNSTFLTSHKASAKEGRVNETEDLSKSLGDKYTGHHITPEGIDGQEYDVLIASLLTDLSTKLQEHHMNKTLNDVTTTDDLVSRVALELNKLIWIPTDDNLSSQSHPEETTPSLIKETTEVLESIINSTVDSDNFSPTFMAEIESLSGTLPDTFKSMQIKSQSTAARARTPLSINTGVNTSENYSMFQPNQRIISSTLESTHTPYTGMSVTETDLINNSGSETQNMANNTFTEWEWLRMLKGSTEFSTVDWGWLTDALTKLSLNENLADDLRALNDKGRTLLEKKSLADSPGSNGNSEIDILTDSVTPKDGNVVVDGDFKMTSAGDNSASSESDEEVHDSMSTLEESDQRRVEILSDTDGSSTHVDGGRGLDGVRRNLGAAEDKEQDGKSSTNDDDIDNSDNDDITEDHDEHISSVQEQSFTLENTDYVPKKNAPVHLSTSEMQVQFNEPHTEIFDGPLSHAGKLDRTIRATVNKMHQPRAQLQFVRDDTYANIPSMRQKRQTDFLWKKIAQTRPEIKQYPDSQKSHAHHDAGVNTHQKDVNISFDSRHITHRSKAISKNAAERSLQHGLQNQKVTLPQAEQKSAYNSPPSRDSNHHSHDLVSRSQALDHANSQYSHHRASYVDILNHSLSGRPHYSDNLIVNNPYTHSPDKGSTDPGEAVSVEERSAMDLEEIMTRLFLSYWQRFYSLYTRSTIQVTPPTESNFDEEVNETALTTREAPPITYITNEPSANVTSMDVEFSNTTFINADNAWK